jgi:hypothetical protein
MTDTFEHIQAVLLRNGYREMRDCRWWGEWYKYPFEIMYDKEIGKLNIERRLDRIMLEVYGIYEEFPVFRRVVIGTNLINFVKSQGHEFDTIEIEMKGDLECMKGYKYHFSSSVVQDLIITENWKTIRLHKEEINA